MTRTSSANTLEAEEVSEERFRLLVESVQDYAIFMLDPRGVVRSWNRGAERLKGYRAHEIIGQHFSVFYRSHEVLSGRCDQELLDAERDGRIEDEGFRVRKDGTEFWANVIITALRDESGKLVGFAKVTRDLTERRNAENALRESEERFRLLVEGAHGYAIFMLDPNGIVKSWNLGAERVKGYRSDEVIGQHFSKFYRAEDVRAGKCDAELAIALETGRFEEEGYRLRKDGSEFWANVVVTPVRDAHGDLLGFVKIMRDLTERRLAEEERLRLAQAQEANRVKDEFLATISHELRTPLNAIIGWSSLLSARAADPEVRKASATIRRNAQAQARIIEDILDVSRIVNGKLRLEVKTVDLGFVVREAVQVVLPAAAAKGIEIHGEYGDQPSLLVGDATRLQQVIWNLLSNSVKFCDPGGRVSVFIERAAGELQVTVSDTGRGIDPRFLPYVFERFRQADSSTTRRHGGLGLGLSIVRHIVELHGGEVFAESAGVGHGATFRVRLPVRAIAPESERGNVERAQAGPNLFADLRGVRLLVIEDEYDSRELLENLLQSDGATVHAVGSVNEACELFERIRPHVIVSDIAMPDQDGYAFIRFVRGLSRSRGGATPAIALTAYARAEDRMRAFEAGFNNYLSKPVDAAELLRVIRNLANVAGLAGSVQS